MCEPLGFVKGWDFLDHLGDFQYLEKDSAACNPLIESADLLFQTRPFINYQYWAANVHILKGCFRV
jgi:hypothetical protein